MDGRCKTCRFWSDTYVPVDYSAIGEDWKECALASGPSEGRSRAVAFDWDHYKEGPLYTAPDFGCVQHEPREETS